MSISLVIPFYNEEKILKSAFSSVKEYMNANFTDYEVIFVDDGSSDGSLKIANALKTDKIKVITYNKNHGKGYAIRQGVLAARKDIIFFTDCDLAYGLDVISESLAAVKRVTDWDILIGSRTIHPEGYAGYTPLRKAASKTFLSLLRVYAGIKTSDSQTGFKGFKRDAAVKIFTVCQENRFAFDVELILTAHKLNLKIFEMPVKVINHRQSSISLIRDSLKMIRAVSQIKRNVARKFSHSRIPRIH